MQRKEINKYKNKNKDKDKSKNKDQGKENIMTPLFEHYRQKGKCFI